ncbi:zinc-ribbon domain-containing protein [Bacillus cytotoxicus]|nr:MULTISPECIES: zinc-ribbon domain-containing protein [unclassified Bacillus cereus group]
MEGMPRVICPKCHSIFEIKDVLTAQSNQNVIYTCPSCQYIMRNIETSKG